MKNLLLAFLAFLPVLAIAQTITEYSPKDLTEWKSYGDGNGFVTHGQFMMEENPDSKGFMIVSPEKYKDVVLKYEVMTLNPATVLVAILNASDIGESTDLTMADDYQGSFSFWTREVEDYMFGFRVMAHNTTPFVRKHPVSGGGNGVIGLAEKDVMLSGWRHLVECGKKGDRIWLKIDDKTLIDVSDGAPLDAGKISIRVRGTATELGKCLIRNLQIEGDPVK